MKYWWLKKYKGLKIKLIPDLTHDVNTYFVMPKHYKDRYFTIKDSEVTSLQEEDLRILLYVILNHEKIKNNKVILIIDRLLEIPDNSLPTTNYSLEEIIEEIKNLKNSIPSEEKLTSNNIAACYHCMQVFYIDKIKYVNKKGYCLCPFCKNPTIYFDNDFIPMDDNFLRLSKLIYGTTLLGCSFQNLQKLLKKCVKIKEEIPSIDTNQTTAIITKSKKADIQLEKDHIKFQLEKIVYKKEITSREEFELNYKFEECFQILEKNIISRVIIDTEIIYNNYTLYMSLLIFILENLGKNPYLKEIILVCKDKKNRKIYKEMIEILLNFESEKVNES